MRMSFFESNSYPRLQGFRTKPCIRKGIATEISANRGIKRRYNRAAKFTLGMFRPDLYVVST
jgi:hypothetical protein